MRRPWVRTVPAALRAAGAALRAASGAQERGELADRDRAVRAAIDAIGAYPRPFRRFAQTEARGMMTVCGYTPAKCLEAWTAACHQMPHDEVAAEVWRTTMLSIHEIMRSRLEGS